MKTSVSIPEPIVRQAESVAKKLGLSRSELFVKAVEQFVAAHQNQSITEKLNAIYAEDDSTLDPELHAMQIASLKPEKW
jgi:metal-responsive CopG/Arc/MetJ family transcriptional regulator